MGEGESFWSDHLWSPDGTGRHAWLGEQLEVPEVFFKQRNNQAGRNKWS
jgi:hypothetical protein